MMRIGTAIRLGADVAEAIDEVVALEKAGLDVVWVAEAYGVDAASVMGALAVRTERVQIASGILPLYSRTPTLLAMTAAGVDALSGGRAVLGLGASGPQVIEGWHGVAYDAPVRRTREVIEICRAVWRRDGPLRYAGRHYSMPLPDGQGTGLGKPLKIINRPVRERIPIVVAALGDANVAMTAEVADGWLPTLFWPERASEIWGPALARGLARRDPALGPLEIAAGAAFAVGDDVARLADRHRPHLAHYIGGMGARDRNFYNQIVRRYGFDREATEIQDLYLGGRPQEAAAAIPADLLARISLVGSEELIRGRLAAYAAAGVTVLNVVPLAPTREERVQHLARLRVLVDEQ